MHKVNTILKKILPTQEHFVTCVDFAHFFIHVNFVHFDHHQFSIFASQVYNTIGCDFPN